MSNLLLVLMLSISVIILSATQGILAVTYTVNNPTAAGPRFNNEIGMIYTRDTLMPESTKFIWGIFKQNYRTSVKQVSLTFVDNMVGVANTTDNKIYVSTRYIKGFKGDLKKELKGIIYSQMTRVWQFNNGRNLEFLLSGIADYVRLKANLVPSNWVKSGHGNGWKEGNDVTAWFLNYCERLQSGFVSDLNLKIKTGYSDSFFEDKLGLTVNEIWNQYKVNGTSA